MAKNFLSGLRLVNLASDPVSGSEGELYFNTTSDVVKLYSNGAWNTLTGAVADPNPDYITFDTTPETSSGSVGTLSWDTVDETLKLKLNNDITLQIGQETHIIAHNSSGSLIPNGTVVYVSGASELGSGHISVAPYIADGSVNVFNVMGITTQDIPNGTDGYVTNSGLVRDLDTSMWTPGISLYASDTVPGGLTTIQPVSPSETVSLGIVTVSASVGGMIFVQIDTAATADLVTYNHTTSLLEATNVAAALNELAYKKADVNSLATNLVLYPTTASATSLSGYYKLVSSVDDVAYNDTAVNIPTGDLNGTGSAHFIASLAAEAGLFVGSPGSINITTIGNIRKTGGNANAYSEFFFRVFKRNSSGTETYIGQSSTTGSVNPTILNNYAQFSAAGNFLLTDFLTTDRLVVKYYSNVLNTGSQTYEFQFGGNQPVRTLVPIPVSVTPVSNASGSLVDTSSFNGVLSGADDTVQKALETIDNIITIPNQSGNANKFLQTTGSVLEWSNIDFTNAINTASAAAYASASAYTDSQYDQVVAYVDENLDSVYFALYEEGANYVPLTDGIAEDLTVLNTLTLSASVDFTAATIVGLVIDGGGVSG